MFVLEEEFRVVGLLSSRLMRVYGLSRAETEISIQVASGHNLRDIAHERGTKFHTVRAQLKAALAKTATRKQSELSALINRLTI